MQGANDKVIFPVSVAGIVLIVLAANLGYIQSGPVAESGPVVVDRLSLQTGILSYRLNGTVYSWGIALTNQDTTPIVKISATLDMSILARNALPNITLVYSLDSFVVKQETGPPSAILVRSPPSPIVGPTNPLLPNFTAANSLVLFSPPPYLQTGETFPVLISVTYINGTISHFQIQAAVVSAP